MILKKSKIFETRLYKHIYIRKRISIASDDDLLCNGCEFMISRNECAYPWPCKVVSLAVGIKYYNNAYYVYQPIS